MKRFTSWLNSLQAVVRLLISLGLACVAFVPLFLSDIEWPLAGSLAWNAFCLGMIVLSWITFSSASQAETVKLAQRQDESRSAIFILVIASVCVSLAGILLLMKSKHVSGHHTDLHTAASFLGVALSWVLLHTVFTLHYAHMYYTGRHKSGEAQPVGLNFPDEQNPDYMDFAYFSFVLGMAFQVSDVSVSSRKIRRFVLLHSAISFVFNTIIVALTISFLSDLGKG